MPAVGSRTRSSTEDPIFGKNLDKFLETKLPLKTEIYRNYLYRREAEFKLVYTRSGKVIKSLDTATKNKIINDLVESLKHIWWTKASIPVREDRVIFVDIKNMLIEGSNFNKDQKSIKIMGKDEYLKRKGFDKILDISKCR